MIAFYLPGNIPIHAFSLSVALGACLGLFWVAQQKTYRQANFLFTAGLWALCGALIGGRLVYVSVNWDYYQGHALEIPQVQLGGLAWPGALLGGLLALVCYAILIRQPFGKIADAVTPLVGVLALSLWVGCWFDGCVYGPAGSTWWAIPARDEWGGNTPRLPLQLLGAGLTIALFWVLDRYARGLRPGTYAALAVLGLCLLLSTTSILRADPAPYWGSLRLETWSALFLSGLALITLIGINYRTLGAQIKLTSFQRECYLST